MTSSASTGPEPGASATPDPSAAPPIPRRSVVGWAFYDWGSAAFNAVIVTFVFSVYLTDSVGADLEGPFSAATWLSIAIALAGVVIAFTAPVMGQRADRAGRRKRSVAFWTTLTVVAMLGMFFVRDDASYLWLGLVLLAAGSITFEYCEVSYFAMLKQVSRPDTVGRVSGFGWSMGYVGGIFLLLLCYVGFIVDTGNEGNRGLLELSTDGGFNIRVLCVCAALWFAAFAIPMFLTVPESEPARPRGSADAGSGQEPGPVQSGGYVRQSGFVESYRVLFRDVAALWRRDRHTVFFLVAAAVYRDGLAGVFTFGAILAVTVYGISPDDVLLFGVAANLVAALGALAAGYLDDHLGPKPVIVGSLAAMLAISAVLLAVDGPMMFWIFGLMLCAFVGPAQSASRSFLSRRAPEGQDGQMFGLYATTGRAVSFLAPALFGVFAAATGEDRWGIVGIALILGAGMLLLLPVRDPTRSPTPENK